MFACDLCFWFLLFDPVHPKHESLDPFWQLWSWWTMENIYRYWQHIFWVAMMMRLRVQGHRWLRKAAGLSLCLTLINASWVASRHHCVFCIFLFFLHSQCPVFQLLERLFGHEWAMMHFSSLTEFGSIWFHCNHWTGSVFLSVLRGVICVTKGAIANFSFLQYPGAAHDFAHRKMTTGRTARRFWPFGHVEPEVSEKLKTRFMSCADGDSEETARLKRENLRSVLECTDPWVWIGKKQIACFRARSREIPRKIQCVQLKSGERCMFLCLRYHPKPKNLMAMEREIHLLRCKLGRFQSKFSRRAWRAFRQVVAGVRACPALSKSQRCKSAAYVISCRHCFFFLVVWLL